MHLPLYRTPTVHLNALLSKTSVRTTKATANPIQPHVFGDCFLLLLFYIGL